MWLQFNGQFFVKEMYNSTACYWLNSTLFSWLGLLNPTNLTKIEVVFTITSPTKFQPKLREMGLDWSPIGKLRIANRLGWTSGKKISRSGGGQVDC